MYYVPNNAVVGKRGDIIAVAIIRSLVVLYPVAMVVLAVLLCALQPAIQVVGVLRVLTYIVVRVGRPPGHRVYLQEPARD